MKRILAFLVSMSLILTCLSGISLVAFAADDLVLGNVTITHDGSGYVIDTPDKFVAVFGGGNSDTTFGVKMVYHITQNIDLSSANYVPDVAVFRGTVTGWNATTGEAEKRNINIGTVTRTAVTVDSKAVAAGLFNNCKDAKIKFLTTQGTVNVNAAAIYVGGVIGYISGSSAEVSNIDNAINVNAVAYSSAVTLKGVGGVAGMFYNAEVIDRLTNSGSVTNGNKSGPAGGIAGAAQTTSGASQDIATNLYNTGAITSVYYAAGIFGQNYYTVENAGNTGAVSGSRAGGITGYSSQTDTYYRNVFNAGDITGTSAAGGLIGTPYASAADPHRAIHIVNAYNIGTVTGGSSVELGAAIGDPWNSGATVNGTTATSSITNFYDLVNSHLPLYKNVQATFVGVDTTNAYVCSDTDDLANNKATRKTILTKFTDSAWETDSTKAYIYPTLVSNIYDDNLPAIEEPEIEEPEIEENWFTTHGITGAGTVANPYILDTPSKFNAIFGQTNTNWADTRSKVYHVTADLDLSTVDYVPYNATRSSFTGKLYGADANGNKVMRTINIGTIGSQDAPYTGISTGSSTFAGGIVNWGSGCDIQYLTLDGTLYGTAGNGVGAVAGYIDSTTNISNVVNNVDVTANIRGAGIVGTQTSNATVTNCINNGDITSAGDYAAGIIAMFYSSEISALSNCTNNGTITGAGLYTAGIIADVANGVITVSNCVNNGNIISTHDPEPEVSSVNIQMGGIIGRVNKPGSLVTNCVNNGNITADNVKNRGAGGIVGWLVSSKITYCSNTGNITAGDRVGGIVGYDRVEHLVDGSTLGIHNSWNSGDIKGIYEVKTGGTGGLTGFQWILKDGLTYSYTNNFNTGNIGNTSGKTIGSGAAIGSFYEGADSYTNVNFTISGFYSISDLDTIYIDYRGTTSVVPTLVSTYIYNGEGLQAGAASINKTNLIGLPTSSDAVFSNDSNWVAGSGTHPYPQLVGNEYTGYAVFLPEDPGIYTPENARVYYENGALKISWTAEAEADRYELHIDETAVPVTLNSDITSYVKNKECKVQVFAISDEKFYVSEVLNVNGFFGGGSGVANDEYLVYDAEHFANIEKYPSAQYKQMDDFTITEPIFLQEDKELEYSKPVITFKGVYDGNGKILNLDFTLNNSGDPVYAPFAQLQAGTVKNVTTDGEIKVLSVGEITYVSAIVGNNKYQNNESKAYILNCVNKADIIVAGDITKDVYVGGILAISFTSSPKLELTNCVNYGNLTGRYVAGIAGYVKANEVIENCANYGDISVSTSNGYAGGIVVRSEGGIIKNCFNMGNITGPSASGILGYAQLQSADCVVTDCFNIGTLTGSHSSGIFRICKRRKADTNYVFTVSNCYSITSSRYGLIEYFVENGEAVETELVTITDSYYVTPDKAEGSITLEELKTVDLGASYEIKGAYQYPQLKSYPIPADKAGVEFVTFDYESDGSADINRNTIDGYVVKGSAVTFYVASRNPDAKTITVTANNEIPLGEGITEKTGIQYVVNENTVFYVNGVDIVLDTPEITAGRDILSSSGSTPITVDGQTYTRYAIVAGRAPAASGLELKECGIIMSIESKDFDLETAKARKAIDEGKISSEGAFGVLIYGDTDRGLKDNTTYYARPYAIYEDANGKEYISYGTINSFVLAAPVAAE